MRRYFSTACFVLIRLFPLALGLAAVTWGVFVLPVFSAQSTIIHVANRIIGANSSGVPRWIDKFQKLKSWKHRNIATQRASAAQPSFGFALPKKQITQASSRRHIRA